MVRKKAEMIEQDGCQVRVIHLNRVKKAKDEAIAENELDRLARIYKTLGDPTRLDGGY